MFPMSFLLIFRKRSATIATEHLFICSAFDSVSIYVTSVSDDSVPDFNKTMHAVALSNVRFSVRSPPRPLSKRQLFYRKYLATNLVPLSQASDELSQLSQSVQQITSVSYLKSLHI